MKRTTHLLTLSTLVLTTVIITMLASPADASKRYTIESGDIAFIDVFKLIDRALLSEELVKEREDFQATSANDLAPLKEQVTALETQLSSMQQSDPNGAATYQRYQSATGQLQTKSQQINYNYQTLIAAQFSLTYKEIYTAANEIGAQEGYVFVFATRTNGELLQADTIAGITQEILARPLMTPPSGVDITELVRIKLGYPEKTAEPTTETEEAQTPETEPETETPVSEDE